MSAAPDKFRPQVIERSELLIASRAALAQALAVGVQGVSPPEFDEAAAIIAAVKRKTGNTARMAELAVKWVMQNPDSVKLTPPSYGR